MNILEKQWNDGGVLLVSYKGDKNDSIIVQSTANYGETRTMEITFASADKGIVIKRTIRQVFGKKSADFNSDFSSDFCKSV